MKTYPKQPKLTQVQLEVLRSLCKRKPQELGVNYALGYKPILKLRELGYVDGVAMFFERFCAKATDAGRARLEQEDRKDLLRRAASIRNTKDTHEQ